MTTTTAPTAVVRESSTRRLTRALRRPEPGMRPSVLVAGLSTAFGVVLISATGYLEALVRSDPAIAGSATLAFVLGFLGTVLLGLAVYVAAVVTTNTFATVVAGRTRQIAQLRLLGATARSQRAQVARQGLVVGAIGAALGLLAGVAIAGVGVAVGTAALGRDPQYAVLRPALLGPAVVVALTTWAAAWFGSRRVLTVTPLQALGAAVEPPYGELARRPLRNVAAAVLMVLGVGLLAAGIAVGLVSPLGVVVAFAGGLFSFTGLVLGAALIMPPMLCLVGRLFGRSSAGRLAAGTALRHPERSSRMAIGLVIGVTLVTMLAVTSGSVTAHLTAARPGGLPSDLQTSLDTFTLVMTGLVAVSAIIAAVGLVNLLTLGVLQRRRELGLLRTLGLTARQVRTMVLLEATHLTVTALILGLVLGIGYGWAGAQSLLGGVNLGPGPAPGIVAPAVSFGSIGLVVVATALLTLVAAAVSIRPATRVSPIDAFAG